MMKRYYYYYYYSAKTIFWVGCLVFITGSIIQNRKFEVLLDEHLQLRADAAANNNINNNNYKNGRMLQEQLSNNNNYYNNNNINNNNNITASIVVQLSGEMGNNLNKIAMGRGLQLLLANEEEFNNINANIVLRHQTGVAGAGTTKWRLAKHDIQKCFPKLRNFDFQAGNTNNNFKRAELEQKLQFGGTPQGAAAIKELKLIGPVEGGEEGVQKVVRALNDLLVLQKQQQYQQEPESITAQLPPPSVPAAGQLDQRIQVPFIYVDSMVNMAILDRFRDDFVDFFEFDDQACCNLLPEADESVFHFRNFQTELQGATDGLGFTELTPEKTANELFGHLSAGEKVAITTRFNNDVTQQYVHALEARGLKVRVVSGQSGVADFCFMKHAQKELVGMKKSSYLKWAAYLLKTSSSKGDGDGGLKTLVRTYSLLASSNHSDNEDYEWKDEELNGRFHHTIFESA